MSPRDTARAGSVRTETPCNPTGCNDPRCSPTATCKSSSCFRTASADCYNHTLQCTLRCCHVLQILKSMILYILHSRTKDALLTSILSSTLLQVCLIGPGDWFDKVLQHLVEMVNLPDLNLHAGCVYVSVYMPRTANNVKLDQADMYCLTQ